MRKKKQQGTPKPAKSGAKKTNPRRKANPPKPLPPDDEIELSEVWYSFADLMRMFQVCRNTVGKWEKKERIVVHDFDGTLLVNKAYVQLMIRNCRRYAGVSI